MSKFSEKLRSLTQKNSGKRRKTAQTRTKANNNLNGDRESVAIKPHYLRRFLLGFSIAFIVLGILALLWFIRYEDPGIFGSAEKYYQKGLEYQDNHNLKKALTSYEKCLSVSPVYTDARLKLISIYLQQGNYAKAEELLDEGQVLQPRLEEYYRQKIILLTSQNRITEALEYFDGITAAYILVKLNADRPPEITSFPAEGSYTSSVEVRLNIPEGCTVYYTLDGSAPDKNSAIYNDGQLITVTSGSVNIRAFALSEAGMPSTEFNVSYRVYNNKTPYSFQDTKIESIVRSLLGKKSGTVYYKDLESVTSLNANSAKGKIKVIDDLVEMPNLTSVNLDGENAIGSYEPLRRLTQLKNLSLNSCELTSEELSVIGQIIWLQTLSIKNNALTSVAPVTNVLSLKNLDAANNSIVEIPALNKLSLLNDLNLSGNAISSLAFLTANSSLETLNVSNNLISDLTPIATCPAITDLNLAHNLITDLSALSQCSRLTTLNIGQNNVTSLENLSTLTSLMTLSAPSTLISSVVPVAKLSHLTTLDVSKTSVTDFSALSGSSIKNLTATSCGITELKNLVMLNSLEYLNVSGNSISDISSVPLMYQLSVLNLAKNRISDFNPLSNCSRLKTVTVTGQSIDDTLVKALKKKSVTVIQ